MLVQKTMRRWSENTCSNQQLKIIPIVGQILEDSSDRQLFCVVSSITISLNHLPMASIFFIIIIVSKTRLFLSELLLSEKIKLMSNWGLSVMRLSILGSREERPLSQR